MEHMSTEKILRISFLSSAETESLGKSIGGQLKGGEVIVLSSDVGGGKTTFTRGLALGAGSQDRVSSPTFTVSKIYESPKFNIVHYDFYRLNDPGIMSMELGETMSESSNVVVIEWSGIVEGILPDNHLTIEFRRLAKNVESADGDETREVILTVPEEMNYLLAGVKK